jgi:hypothetical protein
MPNLRNLEDKVLANGSFVCWSRRADPYVPVICGACKRERLVLSNHATRKTYSGICKSCTNGESWQDETLANGSVIFWSRRSRQQIPIQCGKCGSERVAHAANIRTEEFTGLCRSCLHTGPTSTTWKGGRVLKQGYVHIKIYPEHPLYQAMATATGYIPEHRLIMAEHIGRPLKRTEVVHHKNGIKTDNRIENLELFASFKDHGNAVHERRPHEGFFPVDLLSLIILRGLEAILSDFEKSTLQ